LILTFIIIAIENFKEYHQLLFEQLDFNGFIPKGRDTTLHRTREKDFTI
jgi:hypothetical protein